MAAACKGSGNYLSSSFGSQAKGSIFMSATAQATGTLELTVITFSFSNKYLSA
jgi:hypothetical protein